MKTAVWSVLGEYATSDAAVAAARRLQANGHQAIETYAPYDVEALTDFAAAPRLLQRIVLAAGVSGAVVGYVVQWWTNAVNYPLIVGSRPAHAAPAFILITFETAVLFGGIAAFIAALLIPGLLRWWRPVFEIDGFERASIDRFWVGVPAHDAATRSAASALLADGAIRVVDTSHEAHR